MEKIFESAAQTAKKVRKELKASFPGIKFSVTSSTYSMGSSVSVNWTDGPRSKEVDQVLNQFSSASFDGMTDSETRHGYIYEGKCYSGASYVSGSRSLTPEYRQQIEDEAARIFEDYNPNSWESNRQFIEAELSLIGLADEYIEPVEEVPSNVVDFAAKRVKKWDDNLTPEQRLKMYVISQLFDNDKMAELIATGKTVDEIFTLVAEISHKELQNEFTR